jgi:hypothetical protein
MTQAVFNLECPTEWVAKRPLSARRGQPLRHLCDESRGCCCRLVCGSGGSIDYSCPRYIIYFVWSARRRPPTVTTSDRVLASWLGSLPLMQMPNWQYTTDSIINISQKRWLLEWSPREKRWLCAFMVTVLRVEREKKPTRRTEAASAGRSKTHKHVLAADN